MIRLLCALGCLLGCLTLGYAQDASSEIKKAVEAGDKAQQLGQHGDALKQFERALQLAEANLQPNDVATAIVRHRIARLLIRSGGYDRARDLLNKAIATLGSEKTSNPLQLAAMHDDLGGLYRRQRVFPEARANYEKAKGLRERKLGPNDPEVGISWTNLGALHHDQTKLDLAEADYDRAVALLEKAPKKHAEALATTLDNLGAIARFKQIHPKALLHFQRALEIRESHLPSGHLDLSNSLNHLGRTYSSLGFHERALEAYEKCHAIRVKKLGADHLEVAVPLHNQGETYWQLQKYDEAKQAGLAAVALLRKHLKENDPQLAFGLHSLALAHLELAEYGEAERLNLAAIKIRDREEPPTHHLAQTLNNLASVYLRQKQLAKAEPLLLRSVTIQEKRLDPDNPMLATAYENLAGLFAAQGNLDQAREALDKARRVLRRYSEKVLPYLIDEEQTRFLQQIDFRSLQFGLGLAFQHPENSAFGKQAAEWLLNGKGLANQAAAELSLRTRHDSSLTLALLQLREVRAELSNLGNVEMNLGDEALRKRWAGLRQREGELTRTLRSQAPAAATDPWVSLPQVVKALPADTTLIEIVRYTPPRVDAQGKEERWLPPRYGAVVLTSAKQPQYVDLGTESEVNAAVITFRKELAEAIGGPGKPSQIQTMGEPESEVCLRKAMQPLSALLLPKIQPHVAGAKNWIVSPDALLWRVPWAALPVGKEEYLVETVNVSHVVTGRQLVTTPARQETEAPLLIAGPDFSLGAEATRDAATSKLRDLKLQPRNDGSSGMFTIRGLKFDKLPGSLREADTIQPRLAKWLRQAPTVLQEKAALEEVVKAVTRPKCLVLSTHGFFLTTDLIKEPLPANPLLCCGLALTGANNAVQARAQGSDDGILTGMEIIGMDLRGTDLVVLSACETGLGQLRAGEGVAGLRQAFQLAGARTVVASLWNISDRETPRIMELFFDNLSAGESKADALRNAQLKRISERRDRYGAAHPFFWAPFNVTGL